MSTAGRCCAATIWTRILHASEELPLHEGFLALRTKIYLPQKVLSCLQYSNTLHA